LHRNELVANTKAVIASLPLEKRFDFSIKIDKWFFSGQSIDVLFVSVERERLPNGMDYFCNMYNGSNKKVPMGVELVFVPTYQIQIDNEMRDKIGAEQRAWRDNEVACFVHGLKDLSTIVTVKDGSKRSIRSIILTIPANDLPGSRRTLFHGVDRCTEKAPGWVYLKYRRDDAALFKQRAPGIAYEIAQLLDEDEISKVFLDPKVGLDFGGEWRHSFSANHKRGKRVNPVPADPALLGHFHSIMDKMNNLVTKRPVVTPEPISHKPISHTPPYHGTPMQNSYATRAASATYTSTTHINNMGSQHATGPTSPGTIQTRTQSVVVIEQYEQRFIHVEGRLTSVENTVGKSARMLERLLVFNGIDLTDTPEIEAPMEVDQTSASESGRNKRICHGTPSQVDSHKASQTNNHD